MFEFLNEEVYGKIVEYFLNKPLAWKISFIVGLMMISVLKREKIIGILYVIAIFYFLIMGLKIFATSETIQDLSSNFVKLIASLPFEVLMIIGAYFIVATFAYIMLELLFFILDKAGKR